MDTRWREAKDVLVVRLDNLGDVLLATPAIHAIRETLPGVRLTLLASPVGGQVAELNADLDDVILYRAPWMNAGGVPGHDSRREQAMILQLKEKHLDGAIIFTSYRQSSLPAAYLCYLADIPLRHAASIDGPGGLLTTRHRHPSGIIHEVERGLDLVARIGFVSSKRELVLQPRQGDGTEMSALLAAYGANAELPLVTIHPGCSIQARTYPWGHFVEVADLVIEQVGCQVVFTGGPEEVDLVERIQSWMKNVSISVAGKTSLGQLAALISLSDLVITNNTGPMHVAAAVKTPVVALFALTNPPQQWGPWRVPHRLLNRPTPCAFCYSRVCPDEHDCLRLVSPREVAQAARELLHETSQRYGARAMTYPEQ